MPSSLSRGTAARAALVRKGLMCSVQDECTASTYRGTYAVSCEGTESPVQLHSKLLPAGYLQCLRSCGGMWGKLRQQGCG